MDKILRYLLSPFWGKKFGQGFFRKLHFLSLKGMNFGGGSFPEDSGEQFVLELAAQHLQKNERAVIFDVGANTGSYAKIAANIFARHNALFTIYSFEPAQKTFDELCRNISAETHIKTFKLALGDANSFATLFSHENASGLSSLYQRDLHHHNITLSGSEQVQQQTLEVFCLEQNIERIYFLKLDVEGHELQVLKGAQKMIAQGRIQYIQFEFGGANIDSRTYFKDFYFCLHANYGIFRILKNGLAELPQYDELMEIFTTTNFLAIKK